MLTFSTISFFNRDKPGSLLSPDTPSSTEHLSALPLSTSSHSPCKLSRCARRHVRTLEAKLISCLGGSP